MSLYQPQSVARYFDDFGEREWTRLVESPGAEVKLHVHSRFLEEIIAPGERVLDVGAGPGRFTRVLASLGASVVVADLSPRQLDLNRRYADEFGFASAIAEWRLADICDLSAFANSSFDAVVCYGGPLSYVFDQRDRALAELCRVTKPGGHVLLSVMTLWGTVHQHLLGVLAIDAADNARIVSTGELVLGEADGSQHHCHLFRADEFRALLGRTGFDIVAMSASNAVSTAWGDRLAAVRQDATRWAELLAMEVDACAQPGCWDLGTHLIAVIRRPKP